MKRTIQPLKNGFEHHVEKESLQPGRLNYLDRGKKKNLFLVKLLYMAEQLHLVCSYFSKHLTNLMSCYHLSLPELVEVITLV